MNKPLLAHDVEPICAFIKPKESLRLKAYLCPAGIPTIGYGHTKDVTMHDEITEDQADALLEKDVKAVMLALAPFINRSLTEGQAVALTSLAFNMGVSGLTRKCPRLMRALNEKRDTDCAKEFLDCCYANGKRLRGLALRRKEESDLFLGR